MKEVVLYFLLLVYVQAEEQRLVNISQGPVRGYKDPDFDVFVYYEIPYATVPKGQNRFKAPLPPPDWQEPFEAVNRRIICPQHFPMSDYFTMQEDCLVTSIYVPTQQEVKLPVVIYFHGGAYQNGLGNMGTPKNLVTSGKIIGVTFNYRVGAHGFLCLGTEDVPGNAGMKDQVALLKWVNKNIEHFGGDPNQVTIAGYSAGAASVDLLRISKLTQGLFQRVIADSAVNVAAFAVQTDPIFNAKEYARLINFTNVDKIKNVYELETFYKTVTIEQLTSGDVMNRPDSALLMTPCVERKSEEEGFLLDSPMNIIKSGNYQQFPILYGFSDMEGLQRISEFDVLKDKMNLDFSDFLPLDLYFISEEERKEVTNRIKHFYFGNNPVTTENILDYVDFFSDTMFVYPVLRSVKLQTGIGHNQIYLYEYSFVDENTPLVPHTNVRGAEHCAQTMIVLDHDITKSTEEHLQMADSMRKIWLNFMINGKPISEDSEFPTWPPVGSDRSPHMRLNLNISLGGSLLRDRAQFWDGIYEKHYREPQSPPLSSMGSRLNAASAFIVISFIYHLVQNKIQQTEF